MEGSLQGQSGSKWISLYGSPTHTSRGSKVVLSLYKLNFGFFAEIISKGTNLEVISYPMQTAQPQFLSNKPNSSQKAVSTDPRDSEQVVRIWYSTNNLPVTCFFHSVIFKPILQCCSFLRHCNLNLINQLFYRAGISLTTLYRL